MLAAKKVVNNTGYLYVRMIITILVSLYSTRLILSALGESDYGIFSLIAGVIALLSFINSGMSVATSRYISFYLGANDMEKLKAAFSSSVLLHLLIGITIVILLEIGGVFLFNGVLNIPEDLVDEGETTLEHLQKRVGTYLTFGGFRRASARAPARTSSRESSESSRRSRFACFQFCVHCRTSMAMSAGT